MPGREQPRKGSQAILACFKERAVDCWLNRHDDDGFSWFWPWRVLRVVLASAFRDSSQSYHLHDQNSDRHKHDRSSESRGVVEL
jgi:hypothetical protein